MNRLGLILALPVLLLTYEASSAAIDFDTVPADLQLYPRDGADSCDVVCAGRFPVGEADSLVAVLYEDGQEFGRFTQLVDSLAPEQEFQIEFRIPARLSEYDIEFFLDDSLTARRESLLCGDVILLNGQSNAVAEDRYGADPPTSEWVRSFGTTSLDSSECREDTAWGRAQATEIYDRFAVGLLGLDIGKRLVADEAIPVAIINGAVGNTSISQHLRVGGPINLGTIYGRLLYRCQRAGVAGSARALVWYQGESDGYGPNVFYRLRFELLFLAWTENYPALEKIYTVQVRPGCGGDYQRYLRETQRTMPEIDPMIEVMASAGLPGHDGCHYHNVGYVSLAERLHRTISRDLYEVAYGDSVDSPDITAAWFTSESRDQIEVLFSQPVVLDGDTPGARLADYFAIDDLYEVVDTAYAGVDPKRLVLDLGAASAGTTLTYGPDCCYHGTEDEYQGPWIRNALGVGALLFHSVPIEDPEAVAVESAGDGRVAVPAILFPNPTAGEVTVRYSLPRPDHVTLSLYDVSGRLVNTLIDERRSAGNYVEMRSLVELPTGLYFYVLTTGSSEREVGRVTLIRGGAGR